MKIFIDLDDTLICSFLGNTEDSHYKSHIDSFGQPVYSIMRQSAFDLLAFCRSIDSNAKILTMANRDWAESCDSIFGFGFGRDGIIARDDYIREVSTYGGCALINLPNELNLNNAIIIDNESYNHMFSSVDYKMRYVFGENHKDFKKDSWIQINEFTGRNDSEWIEEDKNHIEQIKQFILSQCF